MTTLDEISIRIAQEIDRRGGKTDFYVLLASVLYGVVYHECEKLVLAQRLPFYGDPLLIRGIKVHRAPDVQFFDETSPAG